MCFFATPLVCRRLSTCPCVGLYFVFASLLIVLSSGSQTSLTAQSLSLFNLDSTNFPRLRANVYAFDGQGQQITSQANFRLTEDGVPRTITSYACPIQQMLPVSAVLTIDISGSMGDFLNGGTTRLEAARSAATAFVDALANDGSECAIAAFDDFSYPIQDFTANKNALKRALNGLKTGRGTDYQQGFVGNPGGALSLLATAKNANRAVIFLTDGASPVIVNQVVEQAKQIGTVVYCITVGLVTPPLLDSIARSTGGRSFSNLQSKAEIEQIYRELANRIRLNTPCAIEWTSDIPCSKQSRNLVLTANSLPGVSSGLSYVTPTSFANQVQIIPSTLTLGAVQVGTPVKKTVALQLNAGAQNLTIRRFSSSDFAIRVLTPTPLTLTIGSTRAEVEISYLAQDSSYKFATIIAETDDGNGKTCSLQWYVTAGFPGAHPRVPTLELIRPNGGEVFLVGTVASIAWRGVPPTEPVILDYSIDAGKTWRNIDSNATDYVHAWSVPNTPSDICLMRVRQKSSNTGRFSNDSSVVLARSTANARSAQFGGSNGTSIVAGFDRLVTVWDSTLKQISNDRNNSLSLQLNDIAMNNQGGFAFTIANNSGINVEFNSPDQNLRLGFFTAERANPNSIRFNPTNPLEVVISNSGANGAGIYIYRINITPSGSNVVNFLLSAAGAENVLYTPDGRGIVASSGGVRLWRNVTTTPFAPPLIWTPTSGYITYVDVAQPGGQLLIAATCSDNKVRFLRVVTTNNGEALQEDPSLAPLPAMNVGTIGMASFDRTGTFLITAMANGTAQLWEVATGQLVVTLRHETNTTGGLLVNTAFFDPSTSRVVTAGENGKVIVWYILEKFPLQEDVSNDLWRIVRPRLAAKDINMGQAVIGTKKDTTHSALTNQDPYPADIKRIWFKNPKSPFSIVSGDAPFTVSATVPPSLGLYKIEFRFSPQTEGTQTDSVFYQTAAGDTLGAKISGVGVPPPLQVTTSRIDWQERLIKMNYDTLQAVVRNVSTIPVRIDYPIIQDMSNFPDSTFRILGVSANVNNGVITLPPGASITVNLRFTPSDIGRFGAPLLFTFNQPGSPLTVPLFGTGIVDAPRLGNAIATPPVVQGANDCSIRIINIPLPNIGTQTLVLDSIRIVKLDDLPSRDFEILSQPQRVNAKDTGNLRLRFTPQQAFGATFATVVISSNSIRGIVRIPLYGRLERPLLSISPSSFVVLPKTDSGMTAKASITVTNKGNGELQWYPTSSFLSQRQYFRITAQTTATGVLASNATASLQATFLGGLPGITYQDTILIPNSCPMENIVLSATVESKPVFFAVSPAVLPTCASSATLEVPVSNIGNASANVRYSLEPLSSFASLPDSLGQLVAGTTTKVKVRIDTLVRTGTLPSLYLIITDRGGTVATFRVLLSIIKHDVLGIEISPSSLTFPPLEADATTTAFVQIYNRSSIPLILPRQAQSGLAQFRLQAPATIAPYSKDSVQVIFTSSIAGRTFPDSLQFNLSIPGVTSCSISQILPLSASTLPPRIADLVFENFYAAPGDTASTKVFLRNRARVPVGTVISDTIRYNVSLLQPLPPLPFGDVRLGERFIPVSFKVKSDDPTVPLDTLRFRAALGNDTATALKLQKTPETRVPKMTINASTATFRLVGISRAGGLRLVISTLGTLRIVDARPNPASTELTLEFTSHDAEEYTLNLINALGVRPDPMIFGEQKFMSVSGLNTRVLDVSRLPSGIYFIQLRNGRELAARKIIIVR